MLEELARQGISFTGTQGTQAGQGSAGGTAAPGDKRLPPVAGVDGNWTCTQCGHINFANRRECHLCQAPKSLSVAEPAGGAAPRSHSGEDAIDDAAGQALVNIAHLEKQLDFDNLKWKLASVFRKAAKGLGGGSNIQNTVDQFADKAFSQLVNTFGDREWLPQVDLIQVFDAAIKQSFPEIFEQPYSLGLESQIHGAYDRAFDEARVMPLLWDVVAPRVDGKKSQNKVYAALEASRTAAIRLICNPCGQDIDPQIAALPLLEKVQRFIVAWVQGVMEPIAQAHAGEPAKGLPEEKAVEVFQVLVKSDALPAVLIRELHFQGIALPQPYGYINEVVKEAYKPYVERAAKKRKLMADQPKTHYCWFFYNGTCGFSDDCMYAHSEMQLPPHLRACAPWSQIPEKFKGMMAGSHPYSQNAISGTIYPEAPRFQQPAPRPWQPGNTQPSPRPWQPGNAKGGFPGMM